MFCINIKLFVVSRYRYKHTSTENLLHVPDSLPNPPPPFFVSSNILVFAPIAPVCLEHEQCPIDQDK